MHSVLFLESLASASPSLKQLPCQFLREICPGIPLSISISSYFTVSSIFSTLKEIAGTVFKIMRQQQQKKNSCYFTVGTRDGLGERYK